MDTEMPMETKATCRRWRLCAGLCHRFCGDGAVAGRAAVQPEYAYYQAYFKGSVTGLGKNATVITASKSAASLTAVRPQRPARDRHHAGPAQFNIREDMSPISQSRGALFQEITGGTASSPLLVSYGDERIS
jgi:hypothetical protein